MSRINSLFLAISATAFMLAPTLVMATVHEGAFTATEAQATTCSAGSTTRAIGTVTYDDVSNLFTWSYTYGDNSPDFDDGGLFGGGTETVSHFHGPAAPGATAGVQVGTGTGTPNSGSATISASEGADLLAELWYLNVHSSTCGGGEVRGQVLFPNTVPNSSVPGVALLVLCLVGIGIWAFSRPAAARV